MEEAFMYPPTPIMRRTSYEYEPWSIESSRLRQSRNPSYSTNWAHGWRFQWRSPTTRNQHSNSKLFELLSLSWQCQWFDKQRSTRPLMPQIKLDLLYYHCISLGLIRSFLGFVSLWFENGVHSDEQGNRWIEALSGQIASITIHKSTPMADNLISIIHSFPHHIKWCYPRHIIT
jgi:hypothetical protein